MTVPHLRLSLFAASVLLLAGCATPSAEPAPTPTETPDGTATVAPDTTVAALVISGHEIVSQNASGEELGSTAIVDTDADTVIAFLTEALGSEPTLRESIDPDESCRLGSYADWAGTGAEGDGVTVRDSDSDLTSPVVAFGGPEVDGIALLTDFGAQIGDDISDYLASDAVIEVDSMTPDPDDVASGLALVSDYGPFIYDLVSVNDGYPIGAVGSIDGTQLDGVLAPGSWSVGNC